MSNKQAGDKRGLGVIELIHYPNCGNKIMTLLLPVQILKKGKSKYLLLPVTDLKIPYP